MITGLFNQTILIYGRTSYNAQGREVLGASVSVKGRIQPKRKTIFLPNQEVIVLAAIAYVPSDTTVNIGDRLTYAGINYKVYNKYPVPDGQGNTNHIKLELT